VVIRGHRGMAVQLATCCRPIPGDEIIGSIKKGPGARRACARLRRNRARAPQRP
jgi:GTP pyrophosphokinase/guanosine-3',5'-bis(diphosphate) 3'-pyrophosphohydrolase